MKKIFLALTIFATMLSGLAVAQSAPSGNKVVRRIQIKHADPQLIAMLLAGNLDFTLFPEMSTLNTLSGSSGGFGQGSSGFGQGSSGFGGNNNFGQGSSGFGSGGVNRGSGGRSGRPGGRADIGG